MKLTSSKNFGKTLKDKTDYEYRRLRDSFDNFIQQPLTLEMFVPCEEEPIYTTNHSDECYCRKCEDETRRCIDLQNKRRQAEKYVLFKGFYSVGEKTVSNGEIEIIFW